MNVCGCVPPIGSLFKCLQQSGIGQTKAEGHEYPQVSHICGWDKLNCFNYHLLLPTHISREQDQKWSFQETKLSFSYMPMRVWTDSTTSSFVEKATPLGCFSYSWTG